MGMCHSSVSQLVPDGEESVLVLTESKRHFSPRMEMFVRQGSFFFIALSTQHGKQICTMMEDGSTLKEKLESIDGQLKAIFRMECCQSS